MKSLAYNHSHPSRSTIALLGLVLALGGCGRNDVQVYRLAKENEAPAQPAQPATMPAGHPDISGAVPRLQWKLPTDWTEAPPGEMRLASFRVAGKDGKLADMGIIPLPGLVGRDLDNVNRWRESVGLPNVKEEDLGKLAEPVEVGGQTGQLYDQAGVNPGSGDKTRILAAILRRDGVAWFFKMNGDDDLVAQQKPAFLEFLKSVRFAPANSMAGLPPSHPPLDGGSAMAAPMGSAPVSAGAKPDWQVPAGWQEVPGGQFLLAKFAISGSATSQATVNVSVSARDGGGPAANVNRWRGQLGLAPATEADVQSSLQDFALPSGKASLADLSGTDPRTGRPARLLAVMVPQAGQTWFYKLMGDEQLVEQQKEAFTQFVRTAKY